MIICKNIDIKKGTYNLLLVLIINFTVLNFLQGQSLSNNLLFIQLSSQSNNQDPESPGNPNPKDEEIYKLASQIEEMVGSLDYDLYNPELTRYFKNSILQLQEDKLKKYENKDSLEKAEESENLIRCLEQLKTKLEDGKYIAENAKLVDEAYMYERLNPYTYTRQNVRIHEKLYNAYQDKLVPYFIHSLYPSMDCDSFIQQIDNLKNLQLYMINILKNQEARKYDRRIRNRDRPVAIINKLGFPVN